MQKKKKKMEDEKVDDMKRKMESWNGDGSCGWAMAGHWRAWLERGGRRERSAGEENGHARAPFGIGKKRGKTKGKGGEAGIRCRHRERGSDGRGGG